VPYDTVDITSNQNNNNIKSMPMTPALVLENDSINDFNMFNTCNSKGYNKKFVSINSEDNILTNLATPRQAFDTSSNINDYLTHSYSYSTHLEKPNKYRYHHRKNNSVINSSHRRFPSIKKPKNFYEHQNSISSTIDSVKSMLKRHYSLRSKNHSRNHSSSNSKIPSILIQNNIPLNFINEEMENKTPTLSEYCQSLASSVTDNNNSIKPKLNYLPSTSSKIKYDEDLPITDIIIPSSTYSYSSKTVLCDNSLENYNNMFGDDKNDDYISTVNSYEFNNMYKDRFNSNNVYQIVNNNNNNNNNNNIEESLYSISHLSDYSDGLSYDNNCIVDEPESEVNDNSTTVYDGRPDIDKLNINTMDISTFNIENRKEE